MGNSASANNVSLLDQRRYQSEFLRYSQIPYDNGKYQPQNYDMSQLPPHLKDQMSAMKVLPEIKTEPKLKSTNNGAILSAGGTISQKPAGCNLHRSKSISEAQNPHQVSMNSNNNSNDMPQLPPQFKMSRASTQLSINLQRPSMMSSNAPPMKKFSNSSYNLNQLGLRDIVERDERKQKKIDISNNNLKKTKPSIAAPANSSKKFIDNKIKIVPPPTTHPPAPPIEAAQSSKPKNAQPRMFGDTLKNTRSSARANFSSSMELRKQPERSSKVAVTPRISPQLHDISTRPAPNKMSSPGNPVSYLRREKTFDLSLIQSQAKEKFKPSNLSPQLELKNVRNNNNISLRRPMNSTTQLSTPVDKFARQTSYQSYKNSLNIAKKETPPLITKVDLKKRTPTAKSSDQPRILGQTPKTADVSTSGSRQQVKRESSFVEKSKVEKKTSTNSAISNPTVSANSSFKFSVPKLIESDNLMPKSLHIEINSDPVIMQSTTSALTKENLDTLNSSNFYFGMNEACVDDSDEDDDDDQMNDDIETTSLEAINLFAQNIFKMNNKIESRTENLSQADTSVENGFDTSPHDIALNLRPTLPRRQLEVPRFSPVAAWKSLSIDSNLADSHNKDFNISFLNIADESAKPETEIERVYREPSSFNMYQLDAKSGDSGISADKEEVGNNSSPNNGQVPQSYLMPSWTPQQDLEGDEEESIDGNGDSHNNHHHHVKNDDDKLPHFHVSTSGHMFSLSLPRDNQYVADNNNGVAPQNNFYTLQKFRKSLVEVFSADANDGKIQQFTGDGNWLLSSQPSSMDELRREAESQLIMQSPRDKSTPTRELVGERISAKSKSKYKFKFQSTIRQVERRKIADKLSREAEMKEMHRLSELEAMQKVEEEFQRKRAREKNFIQQQLRMASMEDNEDDHDQIFMRNNNNRSKQYVHNNYNLDSDDEVDTRTPYIYKIIEAKSSRAAQHK